MSGLDRRLGAVLARPGKGLSGLAVVAVRGGETAYEGYFGHRAFDGTGRVGILPVDCGTRFRVASISKPVTGIGVMRLVERGLFDLDADLSGPLGFPLRNPHYPGEAITARMLLSHTSSLRDEGFYFPPLPHRIGELFLPGGRYFENGIHFAGPVGGHDNTPGRRFHYCNLGYGVLGTCIERLTGRRFDLYMRDEVLAPLGIDGGYNVNLISDAGFDNIATLYRKAPGEDGPWDPDGPWIPQVDDYGGRRPAVPARVDAVQGQPAPTLDDYVVGTNGALFSPQGGLRITAPDLSKILRLFLDGGVYGDARLLSARTTEAMMSVQNDGEIGGFFRETGLALMRAGGLWGHHGDSYGLLGGMFFDPAERCGFLYLMGGTSVPPVENIGQEEAIRAAMVEALRPQ